MTLRYFSFCSGPLGALSCPWCLSRPQVWQPLVYRGNAWLRPVTEEGPTIQERVDWSVQQQQTCCCHAWRSCSSTDLPADPKQSLEAAVGTRISPDVRSAKWPWLHPSSPHCGSSLLPDSQVFSGEAWTHSPSSADWLNPVTLTASHRWIECLIGLSSEAATEYTLSVCNPDGSCCSWLLIWKLCQILPQEEVIFSPSRLCFFWTSAPCMTCEAAAVEDTTVNHTHNSQSAGCRSRFTSFLPASGCTQPASVSFIDKEQHVISFGCIYLASWLALNFYMLSNSSFGYLIISFHNILLNLSFGNFEKWSFNLLLCLFFTSS